MPSTPGMPDSAVFRKWLENLKNRDPKLHAELQEKLSKRVQAEAVMLESIGSPEAAAPAVDLVLETIVREGRPALPVRDHRISGADAQFDSVSQEMVDRLVGARERIEPLFPLIGRIDVTNYPGNIEYVGTGWMVDRNLAVTNRHVAELIASNQGGKFVFRPGRLGENLEVLLDFRHEMGSTATATAPVTRVVWIESDPKKADFALLEIGARGDGTTPQHIQLADDDAKPDAHVVVIGYPARAPSWIIPDQAWMDRIYGGVYDVKRVAPGMMGQPSRGWSTHDCTTLGGNSGSVVVDMSTGRAVALHFAGLYMIENYCVPASTIRKYLKDQPWTKGPEIRREEPATQTQTQTQTQQTQQTQMQLQAPAVAAGGEVTFTVPLKITISLGQADQPQQQTTKPAETPKKNIEEAARAFYGQVRGEGVVAVRAGYTLRGGRLTNEDALVVKAHPERIEAVRARVPKQYGGYPVEVREASIAEQVEGMPEIAAEAVTSIAYNDDDRTGEEFSFDWVDEEMKVTLHVGPERSWSTLSEFLSETRRELISSIYEFHAAHIADAIEEQLDEGAKMKLVMARQSRDPRSGNIPRGDFDRSRRFEQWERDFQNRFDRIFVPTGNGGLVATSYHIKVTVRDGKTVWLSSGNWKRSSQPNIDDDQLNDPRVTSRAGNREWHVILENDTLAKRFRNHILADFDHSKELGGTLEAIEEQVFVDVPATMLETIELEAPPSRVVEPLTFERNVRIKPLLTPDKQGKVFSKAVLQLIRSARRQLLFQNQYIKPADGGLFEELVQALVDKSNEIDDCRIILRSEGSDFLDDLAALKRRGMDVDRCVRRLAATHTKGIVVDGKRVLVGSHNWSSLGVTLNRDASLIFDDAEAAQYFADVFEIDWARANEVSLTEESVAFAAAGPRIATGDAPPPGYVRIPLSSYLEG